MKLISNEISDGGNMKKTEKEKIQIILEYCKERNLLIFSKDDALDILHDLNIENKFGEIIGSIDENGDRVGDPQMRRMLNTHSLGVGTYKEKDPIIYFTNYKGDSKYVIIDKPQKYSNLSEDNFTSILEIIRDPNPIIKEPKVIQVKATTKYATNPSVKDKVIRDYGFTCMMCEDENVSLQNTFLKDYLTGEFYLEGHHILPMKKQKDFPETNIDDFWNIAPLCPKHHKEMHNTYGLRRREAIIRILDKYNIMTGNNFEEIFQEKIGNEIDKNELIEILEESY